MAEEAKEYAHKGLKGSKTHVKKTRKKTKIEKTMREFKEGELRSGSKKGPIVKNRKQAIAISLNQARKSGSKIPKKGK